MTDDKWTTDDFLYRRVDITTSSHDADHLPRVANAGEIERLDDGRDVQIMHNGIKVLAGGYYGHWQAEIIRRLRGVHEPQEEVAFDAMIRQLAADTPEPVVVEVGSFWAYYSLWALHEAPKARAVMVEPDPAYLELGRVNFALNDRQGEFIQAAVGERATEPQPFECESDGVTRDISTESLPSLMASLDLHRVDLLLVDIQGAELGFLRGAAALIRTGMVRMVLVSTHHHSISGDVLMHQKCLDLVRSLNGLVIAEHTASESASGDGLIAASFDGRDIAIKAPITHCRVGETLFEDPLVELAAQTKRADNLEAEVLWRRDAMDSMTKGIEEERAWMQSRLDAVLGSRSWRLTRPLRRAMGHDA